MTPKTDSVAVLRRLRDACLSRRLTSRECDEFYEALAALSAQGEARPIGYLTIGKFDGEFSFPPTREYSFKAIQRDLGEGRFSVYLHPAPGGVGDAVTDDQCDAVYDALDTWAREVDSCDFGLPMAAGGGKEAGRQVIRAALAARTGKGEG